MVYRASLKRVRLYTVLAVFAAILALLQLATATWFSWMNLPIVGYCVFFGWQLVAQRRRHPVVSIDSQALAYFPPTGEPISVTLRDVAGVAWDSGNGHIGVLRRSDETLGLDVRDLSEDQRSRLKSEIAAIAERSAA